MFYSHWFTRLWLILVVKNKRIIKIERARSSLVYRASSPGVCRAERHGFEPQPTRSCLPVPFTLSCTSTFSYSVCWLFSSEAIATERRRTEWRKWASHKKPFCRRWWHAWLWVVPYHKLDTSASFVIRVSGTISFLVISWELPFPARVCPVSQPTILKRLNPTFPV